MNKLLVIFIVIFSFANCSFAQDTIITVEGEKILISEFRQTGTSECYYKNKKGKEKEIDMEDIFSIRNSSGNETVFYKQDTLKGFYDSKEEMQQYINGILAARKEHKAPLFTYLGAGLSIVAVTAVVSTGVGALFWTPLVPVIYTGFVVKSKPNVEKITKFIPENLKTEKYVTGYVTQVKRKRVNNAILGSVGGLFLGWVGFFAITGL